MGQKQSRNTNTPKLGEGSSDHDAAQPGAVVSGESVRNQKNKPPMGVDKGSQTEALSTSLVLSNINDDIRYDAAASCSSDLGAEKDVVQRYKDIKQFDIVTDYSDHNYAKKGNKKPSKDWVKRIQHEWKLLEHDLPSSIIVRVYEERMDLLRAVIVGPFGTPYHDGLFFFDAQFPSDYPSSPPSVHYHSGGLRVNPNLYKCGKVCLSLLGTWYGKGCERWNSTKSSMLQVLLSIQGLVLNEKPYFNEPSYASSAGKTKGEKNSLAYNQEVFLLSCKTMTYTLQRPPKNFEDYVARHFRERGRIILIACLSYMKNCQVGCKLQNQVPDVDLNDRNISKSRFKLTLKSLYQDLLMEFTVKGADCDAFLAKK